MRLWNMAAAVAGLLVFCAAGVAAEREGVIAGELRSYSTVSSVGVEWDVEGDVNHNATCAVRYRAQGEEKWREGFNLLRVDSHTWFGEENADRPYNMVAGSVLFLDPGRAYELRLTLSDPDGGDEERTVLISTRPTPARPTGGRVFHVAPGASGGSGTADDPFLGIESATAAARPGDTFLLHAGAYGMVTLDASGEAGRYVAFASAGDGEAVISHAHVSGSWVWLEGLTFVRDETSGKGLEAKGVCEDVVIQRCDFRGFNYGITLSRGLSRGWYIADNTIVGDKPVLEAQPGGGEGIELNRSSDHTVCYNRISRVHDGISYPLRNCDIYGNDIFDVADDGVEMDFGYSNIRIWENRILMTMNQGFSFQPQFCGPWYLIRNEVVSLKNVLKFRVVCRFVLVNNTFVVHNRAAQINADMLMKSYSRNNLWIQIPRLLARKPSFLFWNAGDYGRAEDQKNIMAFQYAPDWQTDVDYDGLDWGDMPTPFVWTETAGKTRGFTDMASFSASIGIEKHGVRVHRASIFKEADVIAYANEGFSSRRLSLRAGSEAVDAGVAVVNLSDDFAGDAPDLGAHEFGKPAVHYGPRER